MKALTYIEHEKFTLWEKPKSVILNPWDTIVWVTLGSICTSDLHIKCGSVLRTVPGITVDHETRYSCSPFGLHHLELLCEFE